MIMDCITCAIVLLTAILCARKGFALTIMSILQWFVCIVVGLLFCTKVKSFICSNTSIDDSLKSFFSEKFANSITNTSAFNAMPKLFDSWMKDASDYVASETASGVTSIILTIASFILIVIAIKLICWLITRLISKKHHDGVVGFVDGFFGFIFGAGLGIIYVLIIFAILVPVLGLLPSSVSGFITNSLDTSYFSGQLYDHNFLLELVKNLFS